jgi:hypothetical protein
MFLTLTVVDMMNWVWRLVCGYKVVLRDDGGSCGVDSLLAAELVPLKAATSGSSQRHCGAVLLPLSSSLHVILHHQILATICSARYVHIDWKGQYP